MALALAAGAVYAEHRGASVSYAPVEAKVEQADAAKLETRCTEADLVGCLEKEPTGASPESTPLGASGAVTVQQYAEAYYDTSAEDESIATQNLQNAGLQAIVHEKWTVPGSGRVTADVVVMRFASAQGAQSRALAGAGDSLSATQSDGLELATPGLPGHVYPDRAADAQGYLNAQYFTAVGNLLMIVHFASAASFDQADFGSWALGEYLTLRTARIPAAPAATISAATTSCSPLTACLVSAPKSALALDLGWSAESTPTLSQFVQETYTSSSAATASAELTDEGLTGIAHTVWQDAAGDQVDVILLRFKTLQGAESRAREEIYGIGGSKFGVSGPGSAEGGYTTTADSVGKYPVSVYGYVGDVAVELLAFTAAAKDVSVPTSIAQQQFAKLASVTTASTVPQPAVVVPSAVPSTLAGTSSCTVASDCLMPLPNGATALTGSSYDDTARVTVAQFAAAKYSNQSSGSQSFQAGLLTSRGVRQIVHRAWFGAAGDQTDMVVLDFANAAQAESDAMNYQGAISESGLRFSVPGYPDAVGSVDTTLSGLGNVYVAIAAYTANFEVRMDFYSLGAFGPSDARDAISWFDAQLAELPRS